MLELQAATATCGTPTGIEDIQHQEHMNAPTLNRSGLRSMVHSLRGNGSPIDVTRGKISFVNTVSVSKCLVLYAFNNLFNETARDNVRVTVVIIQHNLLCVKAVLHLP